MEHYFTNNDNLRSEIRKIEYTFSDAHFSFYSDLGVFSKDKVDYGSKLLIETYLKNASNNKRILDVGCGYGFIGIVISKITNSYVDAVDVNKRAVHLTEMNIKENDVNMKVFVSDAYIEVSEKYDIIITNPPIRAGKNKVLEILTCAKEHLEKDGELWFVIRKGQGAKSIEKELLNYYKIEIVEKSKGFYVFKASNC